MKDMKYILVTGGVISGIGKGVVASSIGVLLKHCGVEVTTIKIDPYINIGKQDGIETSIDRVVNYTSKARNITHLFVEVYYCT